MGGCLLLVAAVLLVFGQTLRHQFVNFDDDQYFSFNPHVQAGLTPAGMAWAFQTTYASNWHPLTWLSLMLDVELFGPGPAGPHMTNVVLHAANTVLLFLLLRRLTGMYWQSWVVAVLFGVHPLHVESVAWAAERKDVLSGLFFMLTLLMYARYVEKSNSAGARAGVQSPKSKVFYGLTLLFFALGLMSKPMLVTLPFVLLLLDYWPLERFTIHDPDPCRVLAIHRSLRFTIRRLIREKVPFFVLSAASCVVTVLAQQKAVATIEWLPMPMRIGNALVVYVTYLGQMFYPAGLAVFYPHPGVSLPSWKVALALVLIFGISVAVLVWRRKHPYLPVGWLWYLGTLVPVIGLMQVGEQAQADRYTYLSLIGVFVMLVWGAGETFERWRYRRQALGAGGFIVAAALMGCASIQTSYWHNSESLWKHTLACTSENYVAQNNLGIALAAPGRSGEAIEHFKRAVEIKPDYAEAHNNFGLLLAERHRYAEATGHFQIALELEPDYADAHNNFGLLLAARDRPAEAMEQFQKAIALKGNSAEAHNNLGLLLVSLDRPGEAIGHYEQALALKPDYADAQKNLGLALAALDRPDEAIGHWEQALRIRPDDAEAHRNLGLALAGKGRFTEAIEHWEQALRLKPDDAEAHYNLGVALVQLGKGQEAIGHWEQALRLKPDYAEAHYNLGVALVQQGRVQEAIGHWEQALRLKPDYAEAHYSLGIALEQTGRGPEAIKHYEQALQVKPDYVEAQNRLAQLRALGK